MSYKIEYEKMNCNLKYYQLYLKIMVAEYRDSSRKSPRDEYLITSFLRYRTTLIDITKILHGKKPT